MPSLTFTIFHPDHSHSHWSAVIISLWLSFTYYGTWVFIHIPHGKSWITGLFVFFFLTLVSICFSLFFQLGDPPPMSFIRVTYRSVYLTNRRDTMTINVFFQGLSIAHPLHSFCFVILGVEPWPPACQSVFLHWFTPCL